MRLRGHQKSRNHTSDTTAPAPSTFLSNKTLSYESNCARTNLTNKEPTHLTKIVTQRIKRSFFVSESEGVYAHEPDGGLPISRLKVSGEDPKWSVLRTPGQLAPDGMVVS